MSNLSTEAIKAGIIPKEELTSDELREFIDNIDPDIMGFDGDECPSDVSEYLISEDDEKISRASVSIGGGLTIVDNLTSINYSSKSNSKKYLVVHYTAGTVDNGTAAKANTNYFKSTYRGASAHYFVDCNPIIYRSVKDDNVAWHCGTSGKYYHSSCRNSCAIGVEVCSYSKNGVYYFKDETIRNAVTLCKYIVKKYNIPKENVVMHWHVTHKICAAPFISNSKPTKLWDDFKNAIFDDVEITIDAEEFKAKGKVTNLKSGDILNIRSGPGTEYAVVGSLAQGQSVSINGKNESWYCIGEGKWISSSYVEIVADHWCDSMRDELFGKGIIDTKNIWYDKPVTKGDAVNMVSKAMGGLSDPMVNLISRRIITDSSQWEGHLEEPITKALYLALVTNMLGGISDKYSNEKVNFWAERQLKTLQDAGIISNPEIWGSDFEGQVSMANAIALLYKATNYKK